MIATLDLLWGAACICAARFFHGQAHASVARMRSRATWRSPLATDIAGHQPSKAPALAAFVAEMAGEQASDPQMREFTEAGEYGLAMELVVAAAEARGRASGIEEAAALVEKQGFSREIAGVWKGSPAQLAGDIRSLLALQAAEGTSDG